VPDIAIASRAPEESLSPTCQALLACCRAVIREQPYCADVDLPCGVDWADLIDHGRRHGLIPLLYAHLRGSSRVELKVGELLRRESIGAVAENLVQVRGLRAAARAFAECRIPWMCLKGPLAGTLYSDPSLRPFTDIDVLIRLPDFQAAYRSLLEVGFRPSLDMGPRWQALYFRLQTETSFAYEGSALDLHWEPLPHGYSFTPDVDAIWARAELANILGLSVATPSPCDTLIFLCLHAAKHDWERLIWLVDIAALIKSKKALLDWEAIASELKHPSRKTPLSVSLRLVESCLGVELPARISQLVQANGAAKALCETRISLWQRNEGWSSSSPWPWKRLYYQSMTLSADRLRYWRDAIFRPTPLERMEVPLPFSCRSVYYAFRPLRLVWKFLKGGLGESSRRSTSQHHLFSMRQHAHRTAEEVRGHDSQQAHDKHSHSAR
jgi:hypothetical protein